MQTETILCHLPRPIAVVGNAATRHPFGPIIDRYPTVIRMNNFRIEGYEDRVGSRTDLRCVTGWTDVEQRNAQPEFSPFTAGAAESAHLARYNRGNRTPVATAAIDVHPLIPELSNPSAGFALVQLLQHLQIPADLFAFDGFCTGHYWNEAPLRTTHSQDELEYILRRDNVLLFNDVYPYEEVYDFCHREHAGYNRNVGLQVVERLQFDLNGQGLRILEFGAGNGELAAHFEAQGNRVTAVEISQVAFERIACTEKIRGGTLALPRIESPFDLFVSIDVLEHLAVNDVKMVVRQVARLCPEILVTVSTRPSGLLGPAEENLHLTVKPPEWWERIFSEFFDVKLFEGFFDCQYIIMGSRRAEPAQKGSTRSGIRPAARSSINA